MIYRYGCLLVGLGLWCAVRMDRALIQQLGFTHVGRNAVHLMTTMAIQHRAEAVKAARHRKRHHGRRTTTAHPSSEAL